jgi:hypothetical protein
MSTIFLILLDGLQHMFPIMFRIFDKVTDNHAIRINENFLQENENMIFANLLKSESEREVYHKLNVSRFIFPLFKLIYDLHSHFTPFSPFNKGNKWSTRSK